MEFRTAYGEKKRVTVKFPNKSMTQQHMKKECDINFIVSQFRKTGMISHAKQYEGSYEDYDAIDFHQAMNIIADANSMFESVPAQVRAEFDNDPGQFVKFVTNPANKDEMVKMGLMRAPLGKLELPDVPPEPSDQPPADAPSEAPPEPPE